MSYDDEQNKRKVVGNLAGCANGTDISMTPSKHRLVVEKLVLKDFKSYAGIIVIGPFHKVFEKKYLIL